MSQQIRSEEKILDRERLASAILDKKSKNQKVVLVHGCFDLPHAGHLHYLEAARQLGDCLVVAVHDDASVRRLKGPGRPVLSCEQRKRVLAGLECLDFVTDFHEETPDNLLRMLKPDVLVRTATDPANENIGEYSGEIKTVAPADGPSTSEILKKIRSAESRA